MVAGMTCQWEVETVSVPKTTPITVISNIYSVQLDWVTA